MSSVSSGGGVELDRTVASIRVGHRFRQDLGDLDELCDSIAKIGLLQPITITPDGVLVCGARRLAAVRQLGWERVKVWITSTVSTRLTEVLAEQHENAVRKALTPTEAAALYAELKTLYAADAARRQEASRFRSDGGGNFPPPSEQASLDRNAGKARRQAARAITGQDSSKSLDRVIEVQHLADDPATPEPVREVARRELAEMDADGKVYGHYLTVQAAASTEALARLADDPAQPETVRARAADELGTLDRGGPAAELVKAAQAAIARATNPDDDGTDGLRLVAVKRYGLRAFLATVDEMDGWWRYYDPEEIAAGLSDEQWQRLCASLDGSAEFIHAIGDARRHDPPAGPLADRPPHAACF
jgi:ParB family chromosome partitioning protein